MMGKCTMEFKGQNSREAYSEASWTLLIAQVSLLKFTDNFNRCSDRILGIEEKSAWVCKWTIDYKEGGIRHKEQLDFSNPGGNQEELNQGRSKGVRKGDRFNELENKRNYKTQQPILRGGQGREGRVNFWCLAQETLNVVSFTALRRMHFIWDTGGKLTGEVSGS